MSEITQQPSLAEDMNKGDEQETWPESLLESYGKLPLPSLYDYLLNQEKLAAEIRKQNKELRVNSDSLTNMQSSVDEILSILKEIEIDIDKSLKDEFEDDEEDDDDFEACFEDDDPEAGRVKAEADASVNQMQQILIGMMDSLFNLYEATVDMKQSLLNTIPEHSGIFKKSKPVWRTRSEEILEGYYLGMDCIRNKTLSSLADIGISVIIPQTGAFFDPAIHRAVKQVGGGASRHVAKVIRYGYRRKDEIVRYADVAVYY